MTKAHEEPKFHLYYFKPHEFGKTDHRDKDWWPYMYLRTLICLDVFRGMWGAPVHVSKNNGALGRNLGEDSGSDHNVDKWGSVRGVDVFPSGIGSKQDYRDAIDAARKAGFSAIGIYPNWSRPGMHLGTRVSTTPENPATWGAYTKDGKQKYVSVAEALNRWDEF